MPLTLGDIRASNVPRSLNLCPDDSRLATEINRIVQWLLLFGDWAGTTRRALFQVNDSCVVLPACCTTIKNIRKCDRQIRMDSQFYSFLPGKTYDSQFGWPSLVFEAYDSVPTYKTLTITEPRKVTLFPVTSEDAGGTVTILGQDSNGNWIRNKVNGVWQDGEVLTITTPFITSVATFSSITGFLKEATSEALLLYSVSPADGSLDLISRYEAWETRPNYQRFRLHGFTDAELTAGVVVEAVVKLAYQPVRVDSDVLVIGNLPALELAAEALKAKDDGDIQKADLLLFGDARNQRLGAIPLLQQELRTETNDRWAATVRVNGSANMQCLMQGFI